LERLVAGRKQERGKEEAVIKEEDTRASRCKFPILDSSK